MEVCRLRSSRWRGMLKGRMVLPIRKIDTERAA